MKKFVLAVAAALMVSALFVSCSKKCEVPGCENSASGTYQGMNVCDSHNPDKAMEAAKSTLNSAGINF